MKVEPFLLASTLRAIVAQRLVRKLCPDCRVPVEVEPGLAKLLGLAPGTVIYKEAGCEACNHTGFQGRIGVYEAVPVDDRIRTYINEGADEALISDHAFRSRPTLGSAAAALVEQGLTTAEEAIRISRRTSADEAPGA